MDFDAYFTVIYPIFFASYTALLLDFWNLVVLTNIVKIFSIQKIKKP